MSGSEKTLAIIPARAGSKGLPGKNLAKVGEHSLIGWAVLAALQSSCVSRTVLSTDSQEIAAEGKFHGAEVPFLRPESLANDSATSVEVALHCLEVLEAEEGFVPEWLLLLQPTSPLRTSEDVREAFALTRNGECQAVVAVTEPSQHPMLAKTLDQDGFLHPIFHHGAGRRQDLPRAYQPNGAIYWIKTDTLVREHSFYPERTKAYVMPAERSIDIDTAYDLELARFLVG